MLSILKSLKNRSNLYIFPYTSHVKIVQQYLKSTLYLIASARSTVNFLIIRLAVTKIMIIEKNGCIIRMIDVK